ncbi:MAG: aromatic ring-hydroxylating dioxygenase subunit alpha [Verrucomicrobiota bacterium]
MPIINEQQVREASSFNARLNETLEPAFRQYKQSLSLDDLLEEIQRISELPLEEATTLPKEAFLSDEFFAWEVENVFRPGWMCVAHISQLPEKGDFINVELFGEPLIVIRDKADEVHVLSRVCPHRGMDIMPPGFGHDGHGPAEFRQGGKDRGHTRVLLCPYHSWTFDLDGQLKACPEMRNARGFQRCEWGLHEFRSEVWNGFVFVNLDRSAESSVAEQYAKMNAEIEPWNLGEMEVVFESHWEIPCNWKVLTENFMESYHHSGTHIRTLQTLMPARGTWNEAEEPYHIRCHLPYGKRTRAKIIETEARGEQWDAFPTIPGLSDEKRHEWGLYLGYPLFTFVTAPDQAVWYRIEPVSSSLVRLMTTVMVPKSTIEHPDYEAMYERGVKEAVDFHLEDMEVLSAVQRSMTADGYQRGRLSHLEMSVWLIQRFLAARARGTWPTFDRPGAPSQRS